MASAKLIGVTFSPEAPRFYDTFSEVFDERPAFSTIVVNAPIGYLDEPSPGGRTCDREARALLGPRASSIRSAPSRKTLAPDGDWREGHLDAISAMLLPRYREVAAEMSPFRQRVVYEGQPELSFYQLNGQVPLQRSKRTQAGRDERRALLVAKLPGIDKILDAEIDHVPPKHLLDAGAMLWTARRVFARAAKRLPADAEWDTEGLRTELVI